MPPDPLPSSFQKPCRSEASKAPLVTQCPTGDHEPNVRGRLLLYQPRPLNTAAGRGPLRVGRKEKKLENKQVPWQSSKPQGRRAAPRAERSAGTERLRSLRDPRAHGLCLLGELWDESRGRAGAEVLPGPSSPAPALARDSLRPVRVGERNAGAPGTAPGARDKPEARRVAARGSAAAAAPRAHGDRVDSLGNWSWPGRVPRLPALFRGRRNSQVRRPSLPGIGR